MNTADRARHLIRAVARLTWALHEMHCLAQALYPLAVRAQDAAGLDSVVLDGISGEETAQIIDDLLAENDRLQLMLMCVKRICDGDIQSS